MNAGPVINTPFDEDSPYMHPDGKSLYFSSNGHKTMGGFDIFVSRYSEDNKWSIPQNIGYPLNTPHDDLHFSLTADGKRVYFSSIRPEGFGDRDIYYADIEKEAAEVMIMKGYVLDSMSKKPLDAKIYLKDKNTNEITGIFKSNSLSGKYLVLLSEEKNYTFSVEAENYESFNQDIDIADLHKFEELTRNVVLLPLNK
jgi:Tol biopolymer transport system component